MFIPSPPGDTIRDLLEERNLTQGQLASLLGLSNDHTTELLNGKAAITEAIADKLENAFGAPAQFWLTRESHYRESTARRFAALILILSAPTIFVPF